MCMGEDRLMRSRSCVRLVQVIPILVIRLAHPHRGGRRIARGRLILPPMDGHRCIVAGRGAEGEGWRVGRRVGPGEVDDP
jgi:hypothetical protein